MVRDSPDLSKSKYSIAKTSLSDGTKQPIHLLVMVQYSRDISKRWYSTAETSRCHLGGEPSGCQVAAALAPYSGRLMWKDGPEVGGISWPWATGARICWSMAISSFILPPLSVYQSMFSANEGTHWTTQYYDMLTNVLGPHSYEWGVCYQQGLHCLVLTSS